MSKCRLVGEVQSRSGCGQRSAEVVFDERSSGGAAAKHLPQVARRTEKGARVGADAMDGADGMVGKNIRCRGWWQGRGGKE